jgi:2-oxoisovalerate dehydrogenase E1 component alpha subunit
MIEALVSRLYGHSSSSGALRVKNEGDCIELFERKLTEAGALDVHHIEQIHEEAKAEAETALEQVMQEERPTPSDVEVHTYAPSTVDAVYPGDYSGLPG